MVSQATLRIEGGIEMTEQSLHLSLLLRDRDVAFGDCLQEKESTINLAMSTKLFE